jgi:type IV pilus assembly protein PilE
MTRSRQRGFTLIELMVTVAIIAVLARIAYPSYVNHVKKGVRRSAQAQMLDIANREQQFLLSNRSYVDYPTLTTSGYVFPSELNGKYTPSIAVGTGTVPSFTITFTASGAQASDGPLTLNDQGVKGCGTGCVPSSKW